jgi:hypothetical protein
MAQVREAQPAQPIIRDTKPDHWQFFDPATIPWTPWAMPKTQFKLLHVNEGTGRYTFLLKAEAGAVAGIHKHLGEAEAFILEGEFGYGAERGKAGWYAYEAGGAIHTPDAPKGLLLFAVAHGAILGYNPDGSVGGVIDIEWMYEAARKNGAAGHIQRHVRFTDA